MLDHDGEEDVGQSRSKTVASQDKEETSNGRRGKDPVKPPNSVVNHSVRSVSEDEP